MYGPVDEFSHSSQMKASIAQVFSSCRVFHGSKGLETWLPPMALSLGTFCTATDNKRFFLFNWALAPLLPQKSPNVSLSLV